MLGGERIVRDFGKVMYTLLYFKWITNKDLLHSKKKKKGRGGEKKSLLLEQGEDIPPC